MRRVLVTGGRNWNNTDTIWCALDRELEELTDEEELVVIHGGCPTGADELADQWAEDSGVAVNVFPADWDTYGKAAGPIRNQQMVDGADVCLAFPMGESRGTRDCMRRAKAAGIPVIVHSPGECSGNYHVTPHRNCILR